MRPKSLGGLLAVFVLAGCTHSVHQVHVSDFRPYKPISRGKMVKASAEQFVVMGFVDNTEYIDQAKQKLIEECPKGYISGITTQLSTSHGFFSWTNKALLQGLCINHVANNSGKKNKKRR